MKTRAWVCGPPGLLAAVENALPWALVEQAPLDLELAKKGMIDAIFLGPEQHHLSLGLALPVVLLHEAESLPPLLAIDDSVRAHRDSPREIQLAFRLATSKFKEHALVEELVGPWAHDARGALGVARLALSMLERTVSSSSSLQKVENGLIRLGWLTERLPTQVALSLEAPTPPRALGSLFPTLESYVQHLKQIHSRRPIELSENDWTRRDESAVLVPFLSGFVELALKVSSPKTEIKVLAAADPLTLELSCECSTSRETPLHEVASEHQLSREQSRELGPVPYRLREVARLAAREGLRMSVHVKDGVLRTQVLQEPAGP